MGVGKLHHEFHHPPARTEGEEEEEVVVAENQAGQPGGDQGRGEQGSDVQPGAAEAKTQDKVETLKEKVEAAQKEKNPEVPAELKNPVGLFCPSLCCAQHTGLGVIFVCAEGARDDLAWMHHERNKSCFKGRFNIFLHT